MTNSKRTLGIFGSSTRALEIRLRESQIPDDVDSAAVPWVGAYS